MAAPRKEIFWVHFCIVVGSGHLSLYTVNVVDNILSEKSLAFPEIVKIVDRSYIVGYAG